MSELLANVGAGFQAALTPENLGYLFIGVLVGVIVGILPGLGSTAGIALLIPMTLALDPTTALIMLAGVYYGSMYGGAVTAILINTPGESSNIMTALDGYPLARKGKAGTALSVAAISSFIGGTLGIILLTLLATPLSSLARNFGPAEYFCLVFFAMTAIASLMGSSILKGTAAVLLGLMLATVGTDLQTGVPRFTFGINDLQMGADFLIVAIGLFALGEVFVSLEEQLRGKSHGVRLRGRAWLSGSDFRRTLPPSVRGGVTGFGIGALPGAGGVVATALAYATEVRLSGHRRKFGSGEVEGVAGPEGANSGSTAGTMVPLLTLGIPGSSASAVLLGALMLYGIQPGPLMFAQHPDVAWGVITSMYIGNVVLLILTLPLVGAFARLLYIPRPILIPLVAVISLVGAYSLNNRFFDLLLVVFFGILGWLLRKVDVPVGPMVLALVLGPIMETTFRQSLTISGGNPAVFVESGISIVLLILAALFLFLSFRRPRPRQPEDQEPQPEEAQVG